MRGLVEHVIVTIRGLEELGVTGLSIPSLAKLTGCSTPAIQILESMGVFGIGIHGRVHVFLDQERDEYFAEEAEDRVLKAGGEVTSAARIQAHKKWVLDYQIGAVR